MNRVLEAENSVSATIPYTFWHHEFVANRLPNVLYFRGAPIGNGLSEVQCWLSDDFPDGTELDPSTPVGEDWIRGWQVSATDAGLAQVSYENFGPPEDLNIWMVLVDEPKATPRAVNLVMFAGDQKPLGTIVSRYAFATMGVTNDQQLGAVRWYPDGGTVHQVFVDPRYRQLQLATYLVYAASAFHHSNGWTGIVHGDGRRTKLGDAMAEASAFPYRYRPLEQEMPPMDPEVPRA